MAQTLKHVLEHLAAWSGATALGRAHRRGRTLVLAYHNVIADGTPPFGDRSLHLPRSDFARQLDALQRTHEVVPLGEALDARPPGRRPRATITIDDAYAGAIAIGVEELVQRGLPATIFVAPALIGCATLWWDALAVPGAGLDPGLRDRALEEWRGANEEVLRRARSAGGATVAEAPPVARVAAEADILAAARRPGISLGSHAWSHPNLTRLTREEVAEELARSLAWLRERTRAPAWLAYPYGLFDAAVEAEAARAGYEGALGISGGWLPRVIGDRFALPRVNIPTGISVGGFGLRGAGFLCR